IAALLALLTGACGSLNVPGASGDAAPLIQIAPSPTDTVRAFLDAWNEGDYAAMYAQLSTTSQGLYTFPVFQAIYQEADATLGTNGITYTIRDTKEQGDSAAITYDASIGSAIFGSIDDTNRVMRVVRQGDNRWGVAWTSMDIVNGYAQGTT